VEVGVPPGEYLADGFGLEVVDAAYGNRGLASAVVGS
jgi:hypothetical protein